MPATSTINPGEREFVVDSGASMHMVSKEDLNSAELETVRISKNPTMMVTANGEVLAKEEATVYVQDLDLLLKVMLLENTSAVLSLGKLCEEFCYTYHWTSGQKPHLIKNGKFIATRQTLYHSSYLVYPRVSLPHHSLQHLHRRKLWQTEIPATRGSGTTCEFALGNWLHESEEIENPYKNYDEELQSDELPGVPDWLQEFKHGLVDESVPEHRDTFCSSHELPMESRARVEPGSGKHSVYTHFPKDPNCDIWEKTENYKGFLQKTHQYSRAQSLKILVM